MRPTFACAAKKPMTVNQRRENQQDRIAQGAKSGGDTRWKFSQPIKSGVPRTSPENPTTPSDTCGVSQAIFRLVAEPRASASGN